jgi:hypothetical protein
MQAVEVYSLPRMLSCRVLALDSTSGGQWDYGREVCRVGLVRERWWVLGVALVVGRCAGRGGVEPDARVRKAD